MTEMQPTYLLRLRPREDRKDPDGIRRLRLLLKWCQRVLRFRCLTVEREKDET